MKFGTIGTSWITELFIKAADKTKQAKLHAVYSRSKETAIKFAKDNGAVNWHTNLEEMFNDSIDFVYIASPNALHYEQILKCIDSRKHVFCEKPLVYTEKQWNHINKEAQKNNIFVFEGFRHLFSPNYQILKDNLYKIGQVRSAILHYIQYSSRYDDFKEGKHLNVFSKEFAGGALMDLGVYPLSLAIDLFGEPNDIDYFPVLLKNGIDGSGTLILTYKGFNITIISSKIAQGTIPSEIHGEEGTLTVDHIAPIQSLTLYQKPDHYQELAQAQDEVDMIYQLESFVEMIRQNDIEAHHKWLERSKLVAKWSEKARKKVNILFPLD